MLLIERVNFIAARTRQLYKGHYATGINTLNETLIAVGKLSAKDLENPFGSPEQLGIRTEEEKSS